MGASVPRSRLGRPCPSEAGIPAAGAPAEVPEVLAARLLGEGATRRPPVRIRSVAEVTISRVIAASPAALYDLVSDITQMGRWSPETTRCHWVGGASGPSEGARFRGRNRWGPYRWTTACRVLAASPGSHFAFGVRHFGIPMARWDYLFEPEGEGCRITESWVDQRPTWVSRLDPVLFRIDDRGHHNRHTMEMTLDRLADHVATP